MESKADFKECVSFNLLKKFHLLFSMLKVVDQGQKSLILVLTFLFIGLVHCNIFNEDNHNIIINNDI